MYDGGDTDINSSQSGSKPEATNSWAFHKEQIDKNAQIPNFNQEGIFYIDRKEMELSHSSLFCFKHSSQIRFHLVKIVTRTWFSNFILFVIFVNSVMMGLKDYTDQDGTSSRNQVLEKFEPYINTIIYSECLMKIVALGFVFGRNTYLKDGWNVLDFIVVLASLVSVAAKVFAPADHIPSRGIQAFRAFRLLRPLRLIGRIKSLRGMMNTLISSIAALQATFGLMCFAFIVYAIFGMTVWSGALHNRCYVTEAPENGEWVMLNGFTDICSQASPCPDGSFCGNRFEAKDENGEPYSFTNPDLWVDSLMEEQHWGYNNFDNFGSALLTVFQVTTTDGWTPMMFNYENAGSQILSWFYFISCVIICNFFILNLTVGQMMIIYEAQMDEEEKNETELDQFEKELETYAQKRVPVQFSEGKRNIIEYIMSIDDIAVSQTNKANSDLKFEKSLFQSFAEAQKQNIDLTETGPAYYKNGLVSACLCMIENARFNAFILLTIIANTVVLCCDKYPEYPEDAQQIFKVLNWIFTLVFTFELIVKIIALGARPFLRDYFNIFDALIVITSIYGIIISDIQQVGEGNKQLLILRTFRCFRIFKLFKVGDLKVLVDSQLRTLPVFLPYLALLMFIFYIFALIGMSFFAGKIKIDGNGLLSEDDADLVREGYDNLGMAMITIFQVLMGAEWRFIWYQNMTASGPFAAFYYVAVILVLATVMINLLMAIMLGNYDKARKFSEKRKIFDAIEILCLGTPQTYNVNLFEAKDLDANQVNQSMSQVIEIVLDERYATHIKDKLINKKEDEDEKREQILKNIQNKTMRNSLSLKKEPQNSIHTHEMIDPSYIANSSLGIFHIDGGLRRFCLKLCVDPTNYQELMYTRDQQKETKDKDTKEELLTVDEQKIAGYYTNHNKLFEQVVLLMIILNSIQLAFSKGPLTDESTKLFKFLKISNLVFTFLFTVEMLVKIIGLGFLKNQFVHVEAYFLSGWNQLDFLIVNASLVDAGMQIAVAMGWTTSAANFGALKSLRALRALRPLRAIQRFPDLKQVVIAFLDSFTAVKNVFMVFLLILIIFGVIGVSLFKGQFGSCADGVSSRADCGEEDWSINDSNFDNIIQAMRTLSIMTTTEGWSGVMYIGVDTAGVDKSPIQNNSPYMVWYFIFFMIVGSLFVANLLVGVIIDQYNKAKAKKGEFSESDDTEVKIKIILAVNEMNKQKGKKSQSAEPENWRRHVYNITHHKLFDKFIITVVLLNTFTMAIHTYQSSLENYLKLCNVVFTVIFNLEMILKLIAELDKYFISGWNRLDCFIVVCADLGIILDTFGSSDNEGSGMIKEAITVFRVLRILRIAKLLQRFENVQILLNSLIQISQGINNVLLLLALVIYIYALIGINMFAGAMRTAELDKYNNFDSFGRAILSLVRYSTGEDFQEFMYEYTNSGNGCLHDGEGDGKFNYAAYMANGGNTDGQASGNLRCGTNLSIPFFFSFTVVTSWMVINLIIAAIIDGLATASFDQHKLINNHIIQGFLEIWAKYDKKLKWEITMENDSVWLFLAELPNPFSETKESTLKEVWDPEQEKDMTKFFYKHNESDADDAIFGEHFKVKKLALLKSMSSLCIKWYKRENGQMYVKFDDIAKEWISGNLLKGAMIDNLTSSSKDKEMSSYEANKKKSARLANSNLTNWLTKGKTHDHVDTEISLSPERLMAAQMIVDRFRQIKKESTQ